MRVLVAFVAVLGLSSAARTEEWKLDVHIPDSAILAMTAVGAADVSFLVYDGVCAAQGKRVPTWFAIAEVAVAAPQAAVLWANAGRNDEPAVYGLALVTSGLALHGLISLAVPAEERKVTIGPTFAGGGPGIAAIGRF